VAQFTEVVTWTLGDKLPMAALTGLTRIVRAGPTLIGTPAPELPLRR
jgi:hypothetical protein